MCICAVRIKLIEKRRGETFMINYFPILNSYIYTLLVKRHFNFDLYSYTIDK